MKLKQIRGGAWYSDARHARCAYRHRLVPGLRYNHFGFRYCFSPLFVKKKG